MSNLDADEILSALGHLPHAAVLKFVTGHNVRYVLLLSIASLFWPSSSCTWLFRDSSAVDDFSPIGMENLTRHI
jgi:hypothetical protein